MFSSVALGVLSLTLPLALAQDPSSGSGYVQGVINGLNSLGLNGAADAVAKINSTSAGQQLFSQLQQGNYTVFVPNNAAFQNVPNDTSNDQLAQIFSYHVVNGNFLNTTTNSTGGGGGGGTEFLRFRRQDSGGGSTMLEPISATQPNNTIGRSLLTSPEFVNLQGDMAQVLGWTRNTSDNKVTMLNQAMDITVSNSSLFENLFLNTINGVLAPPGNLSNALFVTNATSFLSLAQQANVSSPNGGNTSFIDALSSTPGFTAFVPTNDAVQSSQGLINQLQNNQTALTALLANHVINGTALYSPDIQNATASGSGANYITAAGEPLSVSSNATGLFVQNQNGSSAQIVRRDVFVSNGVFHIINDVLVETDSNPQQASSAVMSASSAASAMSSTETLPIGGGFTTTSSQMSSATSSPSKLSTSDRTLALDSNGSSRIGSPLSVTLFVLAGWIFAL